MIKALSYTGYSVSETKTKTDGLFLVNAALTDPDFERRWLAEQCTENNNQNQAQILNVLREDCGIEFRAYRRWWSKVIGYFVSGDVLWDNLKYLDHYDAAMSGSNDFHEVAHVKGYSHYGVWSTSVPYTLNRVFEAWAAARLKTNPIV